MSRISENIRKITKAWGGKTTGNGISDALSDLYNNLPFGTKTEMVEIVPEQSVTGHAIGNGWYGSLFPIEISLVEGKEYTIVINGEKRKATLRDISEEWGYESGIGFDDLYIFDDEGWGADWSGTLGETITLAIFGEQEVVTPLPAKYIGFNLNFTVNPTDFSVTADKTPAEVRQAFDEGKEIVAKAYYTGGILVMTNLSVSQANYNDDLFFNGCGCNATFRSDSDIGTISIIQFAVVRADVTNNRWQMAITQIPVSNNENSPL